MFSKLFNNLNEFADHHQIVFAVIVTVSLICFTWGFEKLLETYLWPHKPVIGYAIACFGGLFILWLVQHYILHAI